MKITKDASPIWVKLPNGQIVDQTKITGFTDNGEEILVHIPGFVMMPRLSYKQARAFLKPWGIIV